MGNDVGFRLVEGRPSDKGGKEIKFMQVQLHLSWNIWEDNSVFKQT